MSNCSMIIKIDNKKPVQLNHLVDFMQGFMGEFYSKYTESGSEYPLDSKLYVNEVRKGSFIFELIAGNIQDTIPLFPVVVDETALKSIYSFYEFIKVLFETIKIGNVKEIPTETLTNANKMLSATAEDNGSNVQFAINNHGDNNTYYIINSTDANAIQNQITKELERRKAPEAERFSKRILRLVQTGTGDSVIHKGVLSDAPTERPVKIIFDKQSDKNNVLRDIKEDSKNPFQFLYVVDAEIQRIGSKVSSYKILKIYEKFEDDG